MVVPEAPTAGTPMRSTWLALSAAGLGGLFALGLDAAALSHGGMALVALAALTAALIGTPVAMAVSRAPVRVERRSGAVLDGMVEVWTLVAIGAAAAPIVSAFGVTGMILALLAWAVMGFAPGVVRTSATALVIATLVGAAALLATSTVQGPAYTLLEVRWQPWQPWVGLGLIGGLMIAGAGLSRPSRGQGWTARAAMATAGVGLLTLVTVVLRLAAPFEAGVLSSGVDGLWLAWAPILAVAAIVGAGVGRRGRPGSAAIGLVATVAFAGPAAEALPLWWLGLLPAGLAISLALRAFLADRATLSDRLTLGLGAATAAAVPLIAWPDLPGPVAAAVLGLAPVAVVWVAGTRALLVRRAA